MTRAARRRQALLGLLAVMPTLVALLVLRPAPAAGQDPAVGFFALTVTAASVNTTGEIGAGGGLTPIDSGAPVVKGRLDSSPTASMIAAAVEPGTLYRTGAALANNELGDEVVPVEFAEASHPGGPDESVSDPTGTSGEGPVAGRALQASARASASSVDGVARAAELALGEGAPAAVSQQGGRAEAAATGDPVSGTLVASSTSTAETVTIAGVLTIRDVTGRAVVRLEDGELTAEAATTYGGISVAGTPVELTTDGLEVAGETVLPGQEAASLEDQVNAVLEAAGVQVTPISPVERVEGGAATADSGGVRVRVTTPSSAAVPANVVEVVVGQAVATLAAEDPMPAPPPLPPSTPPSPSEPTPTPAADAPPPTTGSGPTGVPGGGAPVSVAPPTATGGPSAPAPSVAAPAPSDAPAEPSMVLAGRRVPRRTALALFGGWQLLSLSTCTLAAYAFRGGRVSR